MGAPRFISEQKDTSLIQLSGSSSVASMKKGHDEGPDETKQVGDHRQPPNSCRNQDFEPDMQLITSNILEFIHTSNITLKSKHKFKINVESTRCKETLSCKSNNHMKKEGTGSVILCMLYKYSWRGSWLKYLHATLPNTEEGGF